MAGILSLDSRMGVLRNSLSGLAQRQRLIANNLANMDTPGYRALDVPFERVLDREMRNEGDLTLRLTSAGHMQGAGTPQGEAPIERRQAVFRSDGNGVDPDAEMEMLSETALQFDAVTQLLNARIAILRSAVNEGRR